MTPAPESGTPMTAGQAGPVGWQHWAWPDVVRALAASLRGEVEGVPSAATQLQAIADMLPEATRYSSKPLVERVREALRGDGVREAKDCPRCAGSGYVNDSNCPECCGLGKVEALASPVPPKEET